MFRFFFGSDDLRSAAERARRLHSEWLTRALRRGGGAGVPRIPVRAVSEGGFAPVMGTAEGREWAEGWWSLTLEGEGTE
jgi:hypothetical protein